MLQDDAYETTVYFGVAASEEGIAENEAGYQKLSSFLRVSDSKKKRLLTVRMIEQELNSKVISNKVLQQNIITEAIELAKEHNFDGVVLDFEFQALAFDSVVLGITNFYKDFSSEVKKDNLSFSATIFGDTFYRSRPYDVKAIAKQTDTIIIMAYDLHKANGNPGPNFPLSGKEIYGYDFSQMVEDFSRIVSTEKLVVVLGMFGYDWTVDKKDNSVGLAKSYSYLQMKQRFLDDCEFSSCKVKRDDVSKEMHVTYKENGSVHHVWFEDPNSSEGKASLLKQKGIGSIGFWAYSYF